MIAVSGWLVWRRYGFAGAAMPLTIYAVQLLLNMGWTPIFDDQVCGGALQKQYVRVWRKMDLTAALADVRLWG